ncbi:MAG TPA: hypothetical protein VHB02_03900 [Acidimicrobiales bacterium]|nr:hypothetical protein [Acidimicrobiales bacterium]
MQSVQLEGQVIPAQFGCRLALRQDVFDLASEPGHEVRGHPETLVLLLDGLLDPVHVPVPGGADVLLPAPAEEVEVLVTAPVGRLLDDDPVVPAGLLAGPAPQQSLEVVVVDALPDTPTAPGGHHFLHPFEQLGRHQPLVPTRELLTLVGDVAQVIAILKHRIDLGGSHQPGRMLARPTAESPVGQGLGQPLDGVVAGGVQLEGLPNQRSPLGIDGHRPDLSTLELLPDVAVAERCPPERAPAPGLLAHLQGDVGPTPSRLVLVNGGHDRLDQVSVVALSDIEGDRHDPDAELAEIVLDHGGIEGVPEHPTELVDDDVIDLSAGLTLRSDPCKHLLEDRTLVDIGGAATGLHKLPDVLGCERGHLGDTGVPLGR